MEVDIAGFLVTREMLRDFVDVSELNTVALALLAQSSAVSPGHLDEFADKISGALSEIAYALQPEDEG
jgi:hypothetical protein